jgi:hypothetical protein
VPTTLPDRAARLRYEQRRLLAELTPMVVAVFYLLLLAWNVTTLGTNFSVLSAPDRRPGEFNGEYNPMEPSHPIAGRRAVAAGAR